MTIWRDFALNVAYTRTWMIYIHLIANYLDFPEILALRVPLPTLVLATRGDPFFYIQGGSAGNLDAEKNLSKGPRTRIVAGKILQRIP